MIVNDCFLTPQTGVIRGSGTARYVVSANTSTTARFGTITIGGRLVNIDQAPLTRAAGSY